MKYFVAFILMGLIFAQPKVTFLEEPKEHEELTTDPDYLANAAKWVTTVYQKIYDEECYHGKTAKTYEDIPIKKNISCSGSSSITFQQAEIIPKGKLVGHTPACKKNKECNTTSYLPYYNQKSFDTSLKRSVTGYANLKKGTCDIVKVMKKYKDLPKWLHQKGIIYVQDSNIDVSGGEGVIYSCNNSGGRYGKHG